MYKDQLIHQTKSNQATKLSNHYQINQPIYELIHQSKMQSINQILNLSNNYPNK